MSIQLPYGTQLTVTLDLPSGVEVIECRARVSVTMDDPAAAAAAALCEPLEYPALLAATIPGDRIALVLEPEVPAAPLLVAGVMQVLLDGGVEPEDVAIVYTQGEAADADDLPETRLSDGVRNAVRVVRHDPTDRTALSYLGATREAKPIYVNREICDADVVLPIGCIRSDEAAGYLGIHGGLFPAFADVDTIQRFAAPSSALSTVHRRRRREETDDAFRMLGARLTLQVVPATGDKVAHVLAGDADAVQTRGRQLCRSVWHFELPRRAALVVATLEGGDRQQTWRNVGRAVSAARQVVEPGGTIAVCSHLETEPGPVFGRLAADGNLAEVEREVLRDRTPEALAAAQLIAAMQQARVYLLSRLNEESVGRLRLAHVARGEEITRLARQCESCIVLSDAQHAIATVVDETA